MRRFFSVAHKIAAVLSFITMAVNRVSAPSIASAYRDNEIEKIQQILTTSARLLIILCCTIFIIFTTMSKHVLNLFGEFYLQATAILLIMMISQLFNALTGTVPFLLQMTGYERIHKNNLFYCDRFLCSIWNTFDNEFWDKRSRNVVCVCNCDTKPTFCNRSKETFEPSSSKGILMLKAILDFVRSNRIANRLLLFKANEILFKTRRPAPPLLRKGSCFESK